MLGGGLSWGAESRSLRMVGNHKKEDFMCMNDELFVLVIERAKI